ncbi:DUF6526 family protein [Saccharibacillus endophyticus]|uniref:ABC transporter permease n=1 Tax=Saccharibacillus endophyticus TaxID=2060666 RepID=A0ABQ1ZYK8_9BACL|nr:DUF6526 family protein [Saccharibacillus endophyticus]GGH80869.1 hypothetical protein GCM10007362_29840 [Saccharibacillus endophyticus]
MEQQKKFNLRFDWPHHFLALPLSLVVLVASVVRLIGELRQDQGSSDDWILVGLAFVLLLALLRMRVYATKTQDRIVRVEENFRYYRLTGREPDRRLSVAQIIALRNAGDTEFPGLCARAAEENWDAERIRSEIKHFRPDTMRI